MMKNIKSKIIYWKIKWNLLFIKICQKKLGKVVNKLIYNDESILSTKSMNLSKQLDKKCLQVMILTEKYKEFK